jgi:predicted nucleotidyltransferase
MIGAVMGDKIQIELPEDKITSFCRKHHIRKLSLFGSVLRDDFTADSDVDVLVEFEPGHASSFFHLFDMEDELSVIFGGRKVDIRTPEDLSRYFRQQVMNTAVVQYAA